MSVRKEYSYPSKTGLANIHAVSWTPDDASQVKAVFQIMHGMAEHLERYEDFANYMTGRGFAVYINDHIGHGKSVKSDDDLGYFGDWGSLPSKLASQSKAHKGDFASLFASCESAVANSLNDTVAAYSALR